MFNFSSVNGLILLFLALYRTNRIHHHRSGNDGPLRIYSHNPFRENIYHKI